MTRLSKKLLKKVSDEEKETCFAIAKRLFELCKLARRQGILPLLWEADLEENALIKIFMIYAAESCHEAKPALIALQKTINRHFISSSEICEQVIISEGFILIMRGASLATLLKTMTEIFGKKYAARLEQIKDEVSDGYTNDEVAEKLANGKIFPKHNSLYLSCNQIDNLKILGKYTDISKLDLAVNKISDLSPLIEFKNLENLNLSRNEITDITPLSKLTTLKYLSLDENQIADLSPLKSLNNLELLTLSNNPLKQEQINELREALPNCII